MAIKPYVEGDTIYFKDTALNILGMADYTPELWDKIGNLNWSVKFKKVKYKTKDENGNELEGREPQYLQSGVLRKTLHRVVMEHELGEEVVAEAYKRNMVIDHLDNDGLNCKNYNLCFLLKKTNTYKGQHLDKISQEYIPTAALKIYRIATNNTFQITIAPNKCFVNEKGQQLDRVKFLYDTPYELVVQDAETMLTDIEGKQAIDLDYLRKVCRFKDIRIKFCIMVKPTEEERSFYPGMIIERDGNYYIIQGEPKDPKYQFRRISVHYDEDWD